MPIAERLMSLFFSYRPDATRMICVDCEVGWYDQPDGPQCWSCGERGLTYGQIVAGGGVARLRRRDEQMTRGAPDA